MGKRSFIADLDGKLRSLYTELMDDSRAFVAEIDKDLTFDHERLVLHNTANRGHSSEQQSFRPRAR